MSTVVDGGGRRSKTTSAWIVDELRREIVSRKIAAGDRLGVSELSARFDVSGAPVREALIHLAADGYIEMHPNRGAVARLFGAAELRQILGVREALETHQTRLFATAALPEQLDELETIAQKFSEAVKHSSVLESSQLNADFHDIILTHDGNVELINILARHRGVTMMMRHDFGRTEGRGMTAANEHFELIKALNSRDAEQAGAIAGSHVRETLADILACYQQLELSREAQG